MYCKCTSHLGFGLELKRNRYALYGVPEYWLADLDTRTILVLILVLAMSGGEYVERGTFGIGDELPHRSSPTCASRRRRCLWEFSSKLDGQGVAKKKAPNQIGASLAVRY